MATLKAPFLSLAASGSIADALTSATWKGVQYGKVFSRPSNPNTTSQQAARSHVTAAVLFWQTRETTQADKDAWLAYAKVTRRPHSAYHSFMSTTQDLMAGNPAEPVSFQPYIHFTNQLWWPILRLDTNNPVTTNPNLQLWSGPDPAHMSFDSGSTFTPARALVTHPVRGHGTLYYYQLARDGLVHSGLYRMTVPV